MAITNKTAALLERAYTEGGRYLNEAYGELLQARTHWGEICSVLPTNSERIDLHLLLDVPKYAEEVGGVAFDDLKALNYVITPRRFSAGIKMHEDLIDDDNLNVVIQRIQDLADAPADAFCEHTFLALKNGINTTTYGACYDGQAFFSTAHPVGEGAGATTFSNYASGGGATAWYLLDCSKSKKPLIMAARKQPEFSQEPYDSTHRFETNEIRWKIQGRMWMAYGLWQRAYCDTNTLTDDRIWTDIAAMKAFTDEKGRYVSNGPTHLCVAPDTEQVAREVLQRTMFDDGSNASASNEPIQGLNLKLIVDPYLA